MILKRKRVGQGSCSFTFLKEWMLCGFILQANEKAQSSGLKIQLKGIGGSPPVVISFDITVERQSLKECCDISKLFGVIVWSVALLGARPDVTLGCEKVRLGGFGGRQERGFGFYVQTFLCLTTNKTIKATWVSKTPQQCQRLIASMLCIIECDNLCKWSPDQVLRAKINIFLFSILLNGITGKKDIFLYIFLQFLFNLF